MSLRPRRGVGGFLVIVTAWIPACASAPSAEVATALDTRPQPAGSLRAELHGGLSPEGPVGFSLGDSAWTALFDVIPQRGAFALFPERSLVQPAGGELASDVTAFPYRCEEVSPPTPPVSAGRRGPSRREPVRHYSDRLPDLAHPFTLPSMMPWM